MTRKQSELLFIHQNNQIIGLISNSDLVTRAFATGLDPGDPVIKIMTAPVLSISGEGPLFEGLLMITAEHISHIAIIDQNQKITGSIGVQQNMLDFLLRKGHQSAQ